MKLGTKLVIATFALGLAGVVLLSGQWSNRSPVAAERGPVAKLRTVIVIAERAAVTSTLVRDRLCGNFSHCQNGRDGIDVVMLERGVMPDRPITAIVRTDANCSPDDYGISHCSNILELPDGSALEVRHDHNMSVYPCLRPGERVMIEGKASA